MNVNPVIYHTIYDFPLQVQQALEMKGVNTAISEINQAHEERKKETDEINKQALS